MGELRVDKSGDYGSLEAELARLLPLLLSEQGFELVRNGEVPDYVVHGRGVEREYLKGWRTVRSVSAELSLHVPGAEDAVPFASARAHSSGTRTLASSGDMELLFRSALGKLAGAVEKAAAGN
jgi:hypothetical protein